MVDRETTIIDTGDGGAAGIVAGLIVVALVVVGLLFYFGMNGGGSQTIDLDIPAVTVDVTPDGQ
jgi:hypothetical protein